MSVMAAPWMFTADGCRVFGAVSSRGVPNLKDFDPLLRRNSVTEST